MSPNTLYGQTIYLCIDNRHMKDRRAMKCAGRCMVNCGEDTGNGVVFSNLHFTTTKLCDLSFCIPNCIPAHNLVKNISSHPSPIYKADKIFLFSMTSAQNLWQPLFVYICNSELPYCSLN